MVIKPTCHEDAVAITEDRSSGLCSAADAFGRWPSLQVKQVQQLKIKPTKSIQAKYFWYAHRCKTCLSFDLSVLFWSMYHACVAEWVCVCIWMNSPQVRSVIA